MAHRFLAAVIVAFAAAAALVSAQTQPAPPRFEVDPFWPKRYNADGENNHVWRLLRDSGPILGFFGRSGRHAGQFHWVHNIAVDSKGNIYTTEVDNAKRVQKFVAR